ncbi:MAG: response regulator [Campylobacterota bacterium]|nr:response regulator [Campylobacterota bacterium]
MINSKEIVKHTSGLSVMFAEDHDELRKNTAEILKNFFSEVYCATNGEEALEMYEEYYKENSKYYDIVISDIQMPRLDGVELTKSIYDINSSQIIIILSAFDDSHYLLPLINLGIEKFIKKPIDFQELLDVLLSTSKKIKAQDGLVASNSLKKIELSSNFIYDREKSALFNNNENIYLTKYEIIFMQLLTTNVGKIYTNDDIVANYTLNNENLDTQNIRKLLSKLRKKLPENTLESIYGIGYRMVPYLEKVE